MKEEDGFRFGIDVNDAPLTAPVMDELAAVENDQAQEVVETVWRRIRAYVSCGGTLTIGLMPHLSQFELAALEYEHERRRCIDFGKLAALIGLASGSVEAWRALPDAEPESARVKAEIKIIRDSLKAMTGGMQGGDVSLVAGNDPRGG